MEAKDSGISTLETLSGAHSFNEWMFNAIRPYIKGKTLEIGSGIGNISSIFVEHQLHLYVSDHTTVYTHRLQARFAGEPLVKGVLTIDLADRDFDNTHADVIGTFDTVFALNVVEHIEDEELAIRNCHKLLAAGGRLVLLVPAWPALYNRLDTELVHFRRYTTRTLRSALASRFTVLDIKYFNLAGIFGWWLTGVVLRRKEMGSGQVKLYSRLVPLLQLADRLTFHRIGLSLIGVGEKSPGRMR